MNTQKTRLTLAVGASVVLLALPPGVFADTVEQLSAELRAVKEQMAVMQQELQKLREEKAPAGSATSSLVVTEEDYGDLKEEVMYLRDDLDDLDERMMEPEKHAALDAIRWGGDFRFQAHSVDASIPTHISGLGVQSQLIDALNSFGMLPPNWNFNDLANAVATLRNEFPPQLVDDTLAGFAANAVVPGYSYKDDLLRTSRLRLEMKSEVGDNVSFYGRLAMYKVWGDSTGVQVFNGQPTSINWDGTQATYPNSDDLIHLERAYFTWSRIAGTGGFLSIGRRPSTNGVPLNFREDEPRGGTPMGSLFNYQFDGVTLGYKINDFSTLRLCYGVGFESGWGNGSQLKRPADRLDDTTFYGLVWDAWDTPSMYVHLIAARAEDISDGFPSTTILPVNPVTGLPTDGNVPIRYEPGGTIGNMDLAGFVVTRHDGPLDYFVSYGYMQSDPTDYFGPFGGMFADPFEVPEKQDGDMIYLGARWNFNNERTKLGLEYNKGSKYWFNFALSEDDYVSPKTSTRGNVWEAYLTHRIRDRFIFKLAYIDYQYDYSGSGWLLGAPKRLDSVPILGFPTYDEAQMWTVGLTARF